MKPLPKLVQIAPNLTTVVNIYSGKPFDVRITRGTPWGNQWSHLPFARARHIVSSREEAIDCFEDWFIQQPELIEQAVKELAGKRLGCVCKPKACHGDVIARIVNERSGALAGRLFEI
jgi:hypothetical protein